MILIIAKLLTYMCLHHIDTEAHKLIRTDAHRYCSDNNGGKTHTCIYVCIAFNSSYTIKFEYKEQEAKGN